MNETTRYLLREIRNDNRSGASEIAEKAADCLIDFVENFGGETRQDFLKELHGVGRDVIMAQPAMAPLFNLVNSVFLSAEEEEDLEGSKGCVKERARDFVTTLERGWETIADATWPLVQKNPRILVHSYSATLCRVLLALHERGIGFSVTCTESRPLLEGVTMARRLVGKGIPVRLIVDSAAFQLLHSVDLLFVGADTISPLGVTNKIGTSGLAMAAQSLDVPVYVLAGSEKLLPMDSQVDLEEEKRPADEVLERAQPIEILNFYFDRTPLQLVSGVITERGVWDTGVLQKQLENLTIHHFLVDCLKERQ